MVGRLACVCDVRGKRRGKGGRRPRREARGEAWEGVEGRAITCTSGVEWEGAGFAELGPWLVYCSRGHTSKQALDSWCNEFKIIHPV